MQTRAIWVIAVSALLVGCGKEPTVNSHGTDEEQKASIKAVKESLPPERQSAFEEAMRTLLFADFQGLADLADGEGIARRFEDRIDSLTGEEIIAEANHVRELRAERDRQERLDQLEEIAKNLSHETDDLLADFIVERSRFVLSDESGFGRNGTFELSVRNDTPHAVSRAYFQAVLLTPGREIPWVKADFNYDILGGLEPGETADWRLSPNMFGEWDKAPDDRNDAIFIVRPVQLDGPDAEPLGGERLSEYEEERLNELLDGMDGERPAEIRSLLDARRDAEDEWQQSAVPAAALQERDELREARQQINLVRVLETRLEQNSRSFMSEPSIEALIRNDSPSQIEWVRGRVVIASDGRQTPWDSDKFIGLERGGIEPGGEKWVSLSKSSSYGLGTWTLPPEGTNAVTTIHIESIEAPEEEPAFKLEWNENFEARLRALESMIALNHWGD